MTGHDVRHRKRSATEPVESILSDQGLSVGEKRPISTALGALFVFARALAGTLWLGVFALLWQDFAAEEGLNAEASLFVLWIVVAAGATGVLALVVLAWAIWRGSNLARVLVMLGLTASTITAAVGYFVNGEEITIHTTLLTLALDILVLLALSSRDARAWARRARRAKSQLVQKS